MAISVMLEDHTGNIRQEAKLSETAEVARLIRAIIMKLKMPVTDSAGRPITYYLAHNNRRLQENATLQSEEVQDGDTISIIPQFTAGTQFDNSTSYVQPLVVLDGIPDHRLPYKGLPINHAVDFSTRTTQVWFDPNTLKRVWKHARSDLTNEIGGVLLGRVYEENGSFFVKVEDALEAQHTVASLTALTFTDQTWLDLIERQRRQADLLMIGWYHSHPGFGIFLSESDVFIHRHFFCHQPWYLALVVDPFSGDWGVFGWEDGETKLCSQG
jgi:proteasome lid subunit RPN8/RPN11/molybdopterin converting factor small subunit